MANKRIKKDDRLFDYLAWILKSRKSPPAEYTPSLFFVNRWLSMASPGICQIVNETTNRWGSKISEFDFGGFYHKILPRFGKRINYIKKEKTDETIDTDDLAERAQLMECSTREVLEFKKTLAELPPPPN